MPGKLKINAPYIVFIIFVYLLKYNFLGPFEKVAWEIPIKYRDEHFILTHRKFGFKIITSGESGKTKKLALEAITTIKKAIPYAEELISPHIKELVQKGSISLENQYSNIHNRYYFFRENAQNELSNHKESKFVVDKKADLQRIFKRFQQASTAYEFRKLFLNSNDGCLF